MSKIFFFKQKLLFGLMLTAILKTEHESSKIKLNNNLKRKFFFCTISTFSKIAFTKCSVKFNISYKLNFQTFCNKYFETFCPKFSTLEISEIKIREKPNPLFVFIMNLVVNYLEKSFVNIEKI